MNSDYLRTSQFLSRKGGLDYCTSNNLDEKYIHFFSKLSSEALFRVSTRCPDASYKSLKLTIESKFGIKKIVLGSGCEDLIIRSCQIVDEEGQRIGVVTPIFYRITDNLGKYKEILEKNIGKQKLGNFDAIWLTNPNPLTGQFIPKSVLLNVIKNNPKTFFIVDEAAIFFLGDWLNVSLISESEKVDNLIVMTSFGKLHGAAGLRIGFACGNKAFLKKIESRGLTFPITGFTEMIIKKIINNHGLIDQIRKIIKKNKLEVEKALSRNDNIEVRQSNTNCVFCRFKNGQSMYEELLRLGIVSLNLNTQKGINEKGFVRITVHSSANKHAILISKLNELINKK